MEADLATDASLLGEDAEQAFIFILSTLSTAPDTAKREILLTCLKQVGGGQRYAVVKPLLT